MTGRARWEDPELEVVEEVLHVATTLHDMDRGESVRNSLGGDSAYGSAYARAVIWATDTNP